MFKRITAILLALSMLVSMVYGAQTSETIDVSQYINNELFVMYSDMSFEVLKYENEDELREGIMALSKYTNVEILQPNYTYTQTSITSDEYIDRQWAVRNDGTFFMEEEKNEHPVYDTPFGTPRMPGKWHEPDGFGRPGGSFRKFDSAAQTNKEITAKSGIDTNVTQAWNIYKDSGEEVIVAIIDTGIDYTHKDLEGKIWVNEDEVAGNRIDDDGNGYIDDVYGWNFYNNNNRIYVGSEDDHGTHGAGTIAALSDNGIGISGITNSENIKVMAVKALGGNSGMGTTASIIRAIQYAEKNGADICNLSLGTAIGDSALYQVIKNSKMLFVAAAGNDSTDIDKRASYPASYNLNNIIAVSNLNYDGNLHYSSNYGKNSVDIAAPGSYILSTTVGNSLSYMTGTSMSAPMVSAAAAMVYSHFGKDVDALDVKEILLSSATKLEALEGTSVTGGMLNVAAALNYDLNALANTNENESTITQGTAPYMNASIASYNNKQYLVVSVKDKEGDVASVKYAEGEQNEDFFGDNGTVLSLSAENTVSIEAKVGTFTFCATDLAGNTTVFVIEITDGSNRYGGKYRQPTGGRNPFGTGGYAPSMPQMPGYFREIVSEIFPELTPWISGW